MEKSGDPKCVINKSTVQPLDCFGKLNTSEINGLDCTVDELEEQNRGQNGRKLPLVGFPV
jgi:hypothetical protein